MLSIIDRLGRLPPEVWLIPPVVMIFSDRTLRKMLLRADIQRVHLVSSWLEVLYGREERDPEHAALLFDGAVHLAEAIDRLGAGR